MDLRKLQRVIVDALEDVKGQDIRIFNTEHLSDMFERVVVASGTSNRQTRALASSVVEKVKDAGGRVVSVEGADGGEWVLVDCGEAVVHILQPTIRAYYNLEEIWGGKPVRLKPAAASGGATAAPRKAATGATAMPETTSKPAKTSAVKKPAAKRSALKEPALKKPSAKKTPARKTPAKKSSAAKTTVRKTAAKRRAA